MSLALIVARTVDGVREEAALTKDELAAIQDKLCASLGRGKVNDSMVIKWLKEAGMTPKFQPVTKETT